LVSFSINCLFDDKYIGDHVMDKKNNNKSKMEETLM